MNGTLYAIILGIIQGLTEFLPVSSSGHIEIAEFFLGDKYTGSESMMMTIVLHAATALSTMFVFRKDILDIILNAFRKSGNDQRMFIGKIILSMIPAVCIGLFFEDFIESLFSSSLLLVGCMLLLTAILLFVADRATTTHKDVKWSNAIIIGIAQAIAILPGISRSGATIATSVLLGVDRDRAARFSFLMVIPLIFGKMAKDILDGGLSESTVGAMPMISGFVAAFITGILACTWMIQIVKSSKLKYFSYYCVVVGLIAITASYIW